MRLEKENDYNDITKREQTIKKRSVSSQQNKETHNIHMNGVMEEK